MAFTYASLYTGGAKRGTHYVPAKAASRIAARRALYFAPLTILLNADSHVSRSED